ncbi:MAG: flagellar motor protein MotB [Rhodospirillaceae bacterium]
MAKGGKDERPIIIKKVKGGHAAPHGGAWKLAYADFVTAMMAFFLLLWLLNVVTSDQKRGLSDYFAPASVSRESSGSGGVLGGQSLTVKGALVNPTSPLTVDVPGVGPPGFASEESEAAVEAAESSSAPGQSSGPGKKTAGESDLSRKAGESDKQYAERLNKAAERLGLPGKAIPERLEDFLRRLYDSSPSYLRQRNDENRATYQRRMDQAAKDMNLPGQHPGEALSDFVNRVLDAADQAQKRMEEGKQFQEAANDIRQAIQSIPELKELAKSLLIDTTPDGLRIQIVDQEQTTMFAAGSNQMTPQANDLMALLAKAIGKLPNKLSVSGHTDNKPFGRGGGGRDNWDLSTERANASRRALVAAGIDDSRILTVIGRADRELLVPNDPASPRNRRISIVLLRDAKPAPAPTVR